MTAAVQPLSVSNGSLSWLTAAADIMGDNRTTDLACDGTLTSLPPRSFPDPNSYGIKSDCDNNGSLMKFEQHRLATFASWPENAPIEGKKLAKAGFYYEGFEFTVKCFSCKRTIDKWDFGDQAIQRHTFLNPSCDFVLNKSDNVPIFGQQCRSYTGSSRTEESLQSNTNSILPSTSRPQNLRIPFPTASTAANQFDEKTWECFGNLLSEEERLRTFKGWPSTFVKPEDLARNGFFYLRDKDKVQCFFCRGIVGEWEDGDNPAVEHRKHFRRCPFISGYNVGNIRLRRSSEDEGIEVSRTPTDDWNGDVTGKYNFEMDVFSHPEKGGMTPSKLSKLGINQHSAPRHPNYATFESRIRSFQTWPRVIPQDPCKLAEAGFYYAGVSDHVRCFCCDGGLRNWEANDDPWVEHARWFGKCCYLNLMKGHEFVEEAMAQHPPILPVQPGPSTSETPNEDPVNAFMRSSIVKIALETGIDRETIRKVIAKKIELTGTPYDDANALTEACMDFPYIHEAKIENKVITPISESLTTTSTITTTTTEESGSSLPSSASFSINKVQTRTPIDLSVEDENRQLKEMRLCKICMDEEIGVVFLPCGHLISCFKCAPSLKDCPLCRKEIRGTVRTFLS